MCKLGIVGLPNVGKSTFFNALTDSDSKAEASNYPFCTIEPNAGIVNVPDARLDMLAKLASSQKTIYSNIEFVDIAGLVKGASQGQGLGNKFLGHIREANAIVHIVRCFQDSDIIHVDGNVDPLRDISTIETELIMADYESLISRINNTEKKARLGNKEAQEQLEVMRQVVDVLKVGDFALSARTISNRKILDSLQLLTTKPFLYVCNVNEDEINGNQYTQEVKAKKSMYDCLIISAKIESEISAIKDKNERADFLATVGLECSGLEKVITHGYKLLNLGSYFTVGPKEARAWAFRKGICAPAAAGIIHTDFEKGFIRAEVIGYDDYVAMGGEAGAKNSGKMRLEGKDYRVQDGDVMHFRFNV